MAYGLETYSKYLLSQCLPVKNEYNFQYMLTFCECLNLFEFDAYRGFQKKVSHFFCECAQIVKTKNL